MQVLAQSSSVFRCVAVKILVSANGEELQPAPAVKVDKRPYLGLLNALGGQDDVQSTASG